jgi:ABC-type antimicrobial peptide transport system permease subunit
VSLRFYLPESIGWSIWGMSLGMSLLVGVIGAVIPTLFAVNKPIAKALKDEQ